ncbi:uncharacterized protein LOC128724309, partial [Anopheles nili]|uniref:uncharacterized protein LOC128724309 n=1 Tax=Anopheles nili TaxID=185578 RepID=UPI00237C2491
KENDEKIKQIGLATLKLLDNAETGSQVDKLIQRMRVSRKVLSYERTKLLVVLRRFKRYQTQNTQLDCQMQDVSLKQYYELKSELNRIGEKLEENNKRMNRSRQQFENDVARSTHVREKLFDFQNRLMIVLRDVCDVQQNLYAFKQVLCENLERKKKLRKENEKLKLYTTIGKLKPWYKQTNNET